MFEHRRKRVNGNDWGNSLKGGIEIAPLYNSDYFVLLLFFCLFCIGCLFLVVDDETALINEEDCLVIALMTKYRYWRKHFV